MTNAMVVWGKDGEWWVSRKVPINEGGDEECDRRESMDYPKDSVDFVTYSKLDMKGTPTSYKTGWPVC